VIKKLYILSIVVLSAWITVNFNPQKNSPIDYQNDSAHKPDENLIARNENKAYFNPNISVQHEEKRLENIHRNNPESLSLDVILSVYYPKSELEAEKRAYRNVLRWKPMVNKIARDYSLVDRCMLLAIIKSETQGETGQQISPQKAVGLTQIKYQGAWAFLWDALFKEYIQTDGRQDKDYYNHWIRERYKNQLTRIKKHLIEKKVIRSPKDVSERSLIQARSDSWERFKTFLNKKYRPQEYQVAVDISAMYLDHLIFSFKDYHQKVKDIHKHIETNHESERENPHLSGNSQNIWKRVKKQIPDGSVSGRLHYILSKARDSKTWYAAYHIGPTFVMETIEKGKMIPRSSDRYGTRVIKQIKIFNVILRTGCDGLARGSVSESRFEMG
jgi:hypothetical protein